MKSIRVRVRVKERSRLFGEWAELYYQRKQLLVGQSQQESIQFAFQCLRGLSDKPIDQITQDDCAQILDQMYIDGYSKRTNCLARLTGKAVFNLAISKKRTSV